MVSYACILMDGKLVLRNEDGAEQLLEDARRAGSARAATALGELCLRRGAMEEALPLFEEAARAGDADGRAWLGEAYLSKGETQRAVRALRAAAENASRRARFDLAVLRMVGLGMKRDREGGAKEICAMAEEPGAAPDEQFVAAELYATGSGVAEDERMAERMEEMGEKNGGEGRSFELLLKPFDCEKTVEGLIDILTS